MTTHGTAVYFDGQTSLRRDVHVALGHALDIDGPNGARLSSWPLADLRELSAPAGVFRLTREGGPPLARLEIRDQRLADAIRAAAPRLAAAQAAETGLARKIVILSVAAVVSMTIFGLFGIPALADRITPLLPWSVDRHMGETADAQLRTLIPTEEGGSFACGEGSEERPGREALDRMVKKLSDASGLPFPVEIVAVRSGFVNALALPGGPIYLFRGLIDEADTPDEIAGVLAHEIGHVANRDGARRTLQAGGASLLFGFILGDFVGGAAAIAIVQAVSEASYSRDAERAADLYSVDVMEKIGADPRAVGDFLVRLTDGAEQKEIKEANEANKSEGRKPEDRTPVGPIEREERASITDWIASHPGSRERQRTIDAHAGKGPVTPIVDQADFLAIKRICGAQK